jgi:hypothetical protein
MRNRPRIRLGILLVLVLLAGCGGSGVGDRNLVDDWAAIGKPGGFTPVAGTCHLGNFTTVGLRGRYEPVSCAVRHRTETVYVGRYAGPAGDAAIPPTGGSAGARAAYQTCDQRISAFVGAPWRTGRVWIGVTQPSAAAWSGGARWFRCEALEISSIEDGGEVVVRAGSLRGTLASAASTMRLGCFAIQLDRSGAIDTMPPAKCTAQHNAEFAGVWDAGDLDYPSGDNQWATFHGGCRELISKYVGVPVDKDLQYRTGVVSLPGGEDVWALGDRGVRCYLWLDGTELTASLKGKGTTALPVQYE